MLRRALALSALLTITVLAGCLDEADPAVADASSAPAAGNVGGSGKAVTSVFPGTYSFEGPFSNVLTPGTLEILPPQRVEIPSPLGTGSIEMGLFLPDTSERVPILLFSTPYLDAEESVTRAQPGSTTPTVVNPSASVDSLIENFVPHGYAVVTHSVRGTGGSDGCNDLMGPGELADIDAALTWLGTQDWSSGAIAMTGVSYDGSTPWTAAATGNPYVKTILPISGVPDLYGLMYRNGSSEQRGPLLLNALYIQGGIDSGEAAAAPGRLCPEAVEGLALSATAGVLGEDPTGYWQARNRKPLVEQNYKGSVFSIQGLQDWNVDPSQVVPWVEELDAMGLETRQLLGQWGHAWPDGVGTDGANVDCSDTGGLPGACVRADWKEIMLRWLDRELKGLDVDVGAPVQVRDDLGRWRNEEHFPPHDTAWTTLNLNHGLLTPDSGPAQSFLLYPTHNAVPGQLVPDPPSVADVAVKRAADFVLGPVAEDTLIVGLPKVHVTVTPQGPGGYMGATLIERTPDGDERYLGWTSMNLRFADGTTTSRTVMPNERLEVKMEIQPMDSVVQEGNQLVLRLWVLGDRDRLGGVPPSTVALETGGDISSVLVLPTVVRGPEVYFEPPMPK
jgi:putative CocE/NonD family hydrolase